MVWKVGMLAALLALGLSCGNTGAELPNILVFEGIPYTYGSMTAENLPSGCRRSQKDLRVGELQAVGWIADTSSDGSHSWADVSEREAVTQVFFAHPAEGLYVLVAWPDPRCFVIYGPMSSPPRMRGR
jgi:hypothetical protein